MDLFSFPPIAAALQLVYSLVSGLAALVTRYVDAPLHALAKGWAKRVSGARRFPPTLAAPNPLALASCQR